MKNREDTNGNKCLFKEHVFKLLQVISHYTPNSKSDVQSESKVRCVQRHARKTALFSQPILPDAVMRLGVNTLARKIRLAMTVVLLPAITHYSLDPMVLTK